MASLHACTLFPTLTSITPTNRLPSTASPRTLLVSCKLRSRRKRHPSKKQRVSVKRGLLQDMIIYPYDDEEEESDTLLTAHADTTPADFDADGTLVTGTEEEKETASLPFNFGPLLSRRKIGNTARLRLKNLIDMLKNTEKNMLLFDESGVHGPQDLQKIVTRKEALQALIKSLEEKLAETDKLN